METIASLWMEKQKKVPKHEDMKERHEGEKKRIESVKVRDGGKKHEE